MSIPVITDTEVNKCFVYPSDEHNNLFATVDTVKPVKNVHPTGVAVLQNWGQQQQTKMTAKHKNRTIKQNYLLDPLVID